MPITINHVLTATTPDNTSYEIRPQAHWNNTHAATISAVGSEIIGAFSNGGNVSFGLDGGGFVTGSAPSGGAGGGATVNGSTGNVSLTVASSLSMSTNGSTISFGLASNITTALQSAGAYLTTAAQSSVSNISAISAATNNTGGGTATLSGGVSFSNANNLTFYTSAGNAIVASFSTSQSVQTQASGAIAGSGITTAGNNIGLSGTLNSLGLSFSATVAAQSVQGQTLTVSAANTSYTVPSLSFSNANNVSFSLSNNSQIYATVTVPAQTNQSAGIYASSQTFGQSSSSTHDARSLSIVGSGGVSVGWSNSSFLISGTTYPAQSNQSAIKAFGASNTGNTAGNTGVSTGIDWVLAGSNNITISQSTVGGGPNTLWVSGPTVGGAQTGISGIIVSNTTYTSGTVSFSNANGISFGSSAGQAITASYTVPTQTNQSLGIYGSSQTFGQSSSSTYDARSLSVVGSGGVSVGWSNSSFLISGQTTTPQTNQSVGIYGSSQTTGSASSSTYDARSLSFIGAGLISIGNASTSAGGTTAGIIISATQSNQAFSAAGGSSAFQTLGFSDNAQASWTNTNGSVAMTNVRASMYATSNTTQSSTGTANLSSIIFAGAGIASVGITNGSVLISVPSGGGAGDGGVFAGVSTGGNTAGSTGTVSTGNFVLVGSGPISLSQSTGAAGSAATITINAPATSSIIGINGISISTNGSTISISNQQYTASFFEPEIYGGTTTNAPAQGTVYFRPFFVNNYVNANQLRILQQMASQSATTLRYSASVSAGSASSGTASFGLSGTAILFSRVSTGTNANSSLIASFESGTYSYGIGISESVSWSTNVSSMTASWTNSQAISFISSVDSIGGMTTGSFGTSSSSTFSSTSTNANSISSTFTNSFMSQVLSQVRPIIIPLGTTLSPGEYWLGIIQSTQTGSTNYSHQSVVMPASLGLVYYTTNSTGYLEIGSNATIASSNLKWGIGSYSASSNTTATSGIPISQISNTTAGFGNASLYFNLVGQVK